jgi:hypothetical protein
LPIGFRHVRGHQYAEAEWLIPIPMFFQYRGELLLGAMGFAAVTAR